MNFCSSCGEPRAGGRFCGRCGREFPDQPVAMSATAAASPAIVGLDQTAVAADLIVAPVAGEDGTAARSVGAVPFLGTPVVAGPPLRGAGVDLARDGLTLVAGVGALVFVAMSQVVLQTQEVLGIVALIAVLLSVLPRALAGPRDVDGFRVSGGARAVRLALCLPLAAFVSVVVVADAIQQQVIPSYVQVMALVLGIAAAPRLSEAVARRGAAQLQAWRLTVGTLSALGTLGVLVLMGLSAIDGLRGLDGELLALTALPFVLLAALFVLWYLMPGLLIGGNGSAWQPTALGMALVFVAGVIAADGRSSAGLDGTQSQAFLGASAVLLLLAGGLTTMPLQFGQRWSTDDPRLWWRAVAHLFDIIAWTNALLLGTVVAELAIAGRPAAWKVLWPWLAVTAGLLIVAWAAALALRRGTVGGAQFGIAVSVLLIGLAIASYSISDIDPEQLVVSPVLVSLILPALAIVGLTAPTAVREAWREHYAQRPGTVQSTPTPTPTPAPATSPTPVPMVSPAELRRIAAEEPDRRAWVATQPTADHGLLSWLAGLGDPAVDAALARRLAG